MSKLEQIEAYFATSVNRAREPERQGEYGDWLIARVRTLEGALTETQRNLRQLRKAQVAHVRLGLPMIDECITEALKED